MLTAQDTASVAVLPAVQVNALRSPLRLEHGPLAASVLGPELTQGRGPALAVAEVLAGLPGVQADDRHNQALGERLSIRGFGARSTFGIRGIRVLVDGIPATMPDGQTTLNHVDPGRIIGAELVRGAAGAFLGNAAGGALQLRTGAGAAPGVEATVGASALWRVSGGFTAPHVSGYGSWQREAGFRSYGDSERLLLGGVGSVPTNAGQFEGALHAVRYHAENPGSLTAEQLADDPFQANPNNVRQQTAERGTHAQVGLGWQRISARGGVEVRAHAGLRDVYNPIPPRIIDLSRGFGGVRAQISAYGPQLRVAAGGELELQRDNRLNHLNDAGSRGELVLDQRESVRGTAAFAQASWSPRPPVQLFAALRRDAYRFSVTDHLVTATNPDDSGARTLAATSFSAGAAADISTGLQLFGNVGTAFETPTTTELANRPDGAGGFNPELQPERTVGGEAGLRVRHARWSADFTAFRATVRDKLVPFELPATPGRQYFRNAGRARHQGLELATAARLLPRLELRAAYTRLEVRFERYAVAGEDYGGNLVPGVAGHRLEAESELRLGSYAVLLRMLRNGAVPVNDANDASADPYTLISARLQREALAVGGISLALHAGVENLLQSRYSAAVSVNAAGARYYEPGPGRSFYAGLRIAPR